MINEWDVLFRIGIAILCGFLIGLERQTTGHMVGIKTNILISIGSCAFVLFSFLIGEGDKTRIAAQVVTGVGFLCSSVIIRNGITINGINTSATIWCTSAIGVLSSLGLWKVSLVVTIALIVSNLVFYPLAEKIPVFHNLIDTNEEKIYRLCVSCGANNTMSVRKIIVETLENTDFILTGLETKIDENNPMKNTTIHATLNHIGKMDNRYLENIVTTLYQNELIDGVNWKLS